MSVEDNKVLIEKLPDQQWLVIRTKPRAEKKVDEFCKGRGIISYLPLRRSVRRYKTRTVEFLVPIFSGYVFCQVPHEQLHIVNECRNVAHLLRPDEQMEEVLISELKSIQIFEAAMMKGEISVKPEIAVGSQVTIKSGPFAGLNGIVSRWKNKVRLSVNVDMVGQAVCLEMDSGEVELDF